MMFAPGDLVVCVYDSPCPVFGKYDAIKGAVYRIVAVKHGKCRQTGYEATGVRLDRHNPGTKYYNAIRFRKIDPLQDLDTRAALETYRLKPALNPARHSVELS